MKTKYICFFICLVTSHVLAQFSSKNYDLVKTTALRKFDKGIIGSYLKGDSANVKAALLALANSRDTSFVPLITKLDFSKYGDLISFALGEIGPNKHSQEYLLRKLLDNDARFTKPILTSLGQVGDSSSLKQLFEMKLADSSGLPFTIYNYATRGIIVDKEKEAQFLYSLATESKNDQEKIDAFFVLARIRIPEGLKKSFLNYFRNNFEKSNTELKILLLKNLNTLQSFDLPNKIIYTIETDKDWRVRTEGVKALTKYNFKNEKELSDYLISLSDPNPNVSRQAAISLKNVKISPSLEGFVIDKITKLIYETNLTTNTRGELFVSLCKIDSSRTKELITKYKNNLPKNFIYNVLAENTTDPNWNYSFNKANLKNADEVELLDLTPALLALQKYLVNDKDYKQNILNLLASGYPSTISIVADGLEDTLINNMKPMLQPIIKFQVEKYLNNSKFLESLMSLNNLSAKISPNFKNEILKTLVTSNLSAITSLANKELENNAPTPEKPMPVFDKIWSYSFKYSKAIVVTNKGQFTIKFLPEYAPVSVGNFLMLADEGFFKDIKFHRVVPNFVIQAGDPSGTGWGGSDNEIVSEFSPLPFEEDAVGMASAGRDTESSQWFVMHSYYPHLNGRYTNFGKVIKGMDVVSSIDQGDMILKVIPIH